MSREEYRILVIYKKHDLKSLASAMSMFNDLQKEHINHSKMVYNTSNLALFENGVSIEVGSMDEIQSDVINSIDRFYVEESVSISFKNKGFKFIKFNSDGLIL